MERKIRGEEKKAEMELRKLRIDVITTAREICTADYDEKKYYLFFWNVDMYE